MSTKCQALAQRHRIQTITHSKTTQRFNLSPLGFSPEQSHSWWKQSLAGTLHHCPALAAGGHKHITSGETPKLLAMQHEHVVRGQDRQQGGDLGPAISLWSTCYHGHCSSTVPLRGSLCSEALHFLVFHDILYCWRFYCYFSYSFPFSREKSGISNGKLHPCPWAGF